jgi:hypothetical protein
MAARWVYAAQDGRAHLLADPIAGGSMATTTTMCELTVPATVTVFSTPPTLDVCESCARCSVFSVNTGLPRFGTQPAPP